MAKLTDEEISEGRRLSVDPTAESTDLRAHLAASLDEIGRLKGIIGRNKANFLGLQQVCAQQRTEIEGYKRKLGARNLVDELQDGMEKRKRDRMDSFGEALYDALCEKRGGRGEN